jgi:outer membrane protein OmpA-like peptidoglycan-associated protein
MRTAIAALLLSLASAPSVFAQEDAEGCKDHPLFTRMPNTLITGCEDQEFSVYEFATEPESRKVEGHYWRLDFEFKEGTKAAGPLQITRNYWNAMAKQGGKRVLENVDAGGGTMIATMPGKPGTVWVQVDIGNSGEMFALHVVQEQGMRQDVELTAADMAAALAKDGTLTLNNILFDTGKSSIRPESDAVLSTVVELLKAQATLSLEIQGHTDNVGGKDANLKLSKDRAEAVKARLVSGGIAAARLTTAGLGDSQPVGDNATDEGRAQNRRVVLVRK